MARMLREVVEQAGLDRVEVIGDDVVDPSVDFDSRQVRPGSLFCCLRGLQSDGHGFAGRRRSSPVRRRCSSTIDSTSICRNSSSPTPVGDGLAGGELRPAPRRAMTLVGVTGTNGKTTTTSLIAAILTAAGGRPA